MVSWPVRRANGLEHPCTSQSKAIFALRSGSTVARPRAGVWVAGDRGSCESGHGRWCCPSFHARWRTGCSQSTGCPPRSAVTCSGRIPKATCSATGNDWEEVTLPVSADPDRSGWSVRVAPVARPHYRASGRLSQRLGHRAPREEPVCPGRQHGSGASGRCATRWRRVARDRMSDPFVCMISSVSSVARPDR